jgi:hypothetical protein
VGSYNHKLVQVGNDWYLQSTSDGSGSGGGDDDSNDIDMADSFTPVPTLAPSLLTTLTLLLGALGWQARRRVQ